MFSPYLTKQKYIQPSFKYPDPSFFPVHAVFSLISFIRTLSLKR